jgi:predicted nucleic acid-binding protein
MIIVLDTNVLVAATLSPFGASFQILAMVPQRRFELLLSVPLMLEYEEMLKREDIRAKSHLSLEEIDVLLELPDPDDEMLLELAANGRADTIVTMNTRDFLPAAGSFGVEILRPGEFLRRLRS